MIIIIIIIIIKYHPAVFCSTRFSIYIGNNTGNVTYKLHDGIVSGRMAAHTATMVVTRGVGVKTNACRLIANIFTRTLYL